MCKSICKDCVCMFVRLCVCVCVCVCVCGAKLIIRREIIPPIADSNKFDLTDCAHKYTQCRQLHKCFCGQLCVRVYMCVCAWVCLYRCVTFMLMCACICVRACVCGVVQTNLVIIAVGWKSQEKASLVFNWAPCTYLFSLWGLRRFSLHQGVGAFSHRVSKKHTTPYSTGIQTEWSSKRCDLRALTWQQHIVSLCASASSVWPSCVRFTRCRATQTFSYIARGAAGV